MIAKKVTEHLQERREVHRGLNNGVVSEYRKEREMCMIRENIEALRC